MVSIFTVAKYILDKQGAMSKYKLNYLCYYAQAWHYTWTKKRLIKEDFQAWRNGPMCPELIEILDGLFMVDSAKLDKAIEDYRRRQIHLPERIEADDNG